MTIDISKLPAPEVIQQVSYEDIFEAMLTDFQARNPELEISQADPVYKILEIAAYHVMLVHQNFNDRAKSLMLAYSSESDLDHLGVTYYQLQRLTITPGDATAVPPIDPVYESDSAYLNRILLSEQGQSTAGPKSAYVFHAMSADGQVKDAKALAHTPNPGDVTIAVLSHTGDGTTDQAVLDIITAALSDEDIRPLNDTPIVQSATIVTYTINASLTLFIGSDANTILQSAQNALSQFVADQHRIGRDITLDGLYKALRVVGVAKVVLNNTVGTDLIAELVTAPDEAPYCSGVTVNVGGYSE